MKILLITHLVPYPPHDGPSLRNFNLIKECSRNNKIHLLTFYRKAHGHNPDNLKASIDELKKYCEIVKVFRIPTNVNNLAWLILLFLNIFSSAPYSQWEYWSPMMSKAIKQHLRKYSYDVIEIGEIGLVKYAKICKGIPKILVHHNIESQLLLRRSEVMNNPLARAYLKFQARKLKKSEYWACEAIDYHTTVSENDQKTLRNINYKAKIQVVPNGVDIDYFKPMEYEVKSNSLIFAGTMNWYPNLDAMNYFKDQIWPLLKKGIPDITINVIGKNPPSDLIAFSKRDKNFGVLGFVEDIRPYIAQAALYIVPIRAGGGSRLKILDALASGKAIISTTVGAEGIAITDGKDIILADTPQDFAKKTVQLLNDLNMRKKLEKNARKTATDNYSWKSIAPKLNKIYNILGTTKNMS